MLSNDRPERKEEITLNICEISLISGKDVTLRVT